MERDVPIALWPAASSMRPYQPDEDIGLHLRAPSVLALGNHARRYHGAMHLPRVLCGRRAFRSAALALVRHGFVVAGALLALPCLASTSVYLQRPPDPQAVDFARPQFDVHADGVADDAPALQAAIDRVHAAPEHRGILFIGPGRYHLGDGRHGRIYEWTAEHGVQLWHASAVRPAMLTVDPQSGALVVIARSGRAFRLVETPPNEPTLEPVPQVAAAAAPRAGWPRPANIYGTMNFIPTATQTADSAWRIDSVCLPVDHTRYSNVRMPSWANNPFWRAYNLHVASPGADFFMADEFRQKTYRFRVAADGHLQNPRLFAEVGEADVVQDSGGRVYVAAGDIFVFGDDGALLSRIPLPQRPLSLAFRRGDEATLFVAARHALYAITLLR